jgi:hypothetical protein
MMDGMQNLRLWFERKYEKLAIEALLKLIECASQSTQEPLKGFQRDYENDRMEGQMFSTSEI